MRGKALIRQLYLRDDFQGDGIDDSKKGGRFGKEFEVLVLQRQRDHKDVMGHGVELNMPDVITKWRVKTKGNLCNEFVVDSINDCHILILQGNICVIWADCNSRVTNKDPVIYLVIFD